MNDRSKLARKSGEPEGPAYSAPALEKGLDILELLCRSESPLSQKEIALQLSISPKTAGNHVSAILAKLDVETRTAAVAQSLRRGLV